QSLMLLHTLRTQLDYFQRLIPKLTSHFTVYAVDLPGLGWSDISPGASYEEPSVRTAVVEIFAKLHPKDLTLVGESIGATLSLTTSTQLGWRVRNIVALNTYAIRRGQSGRTSSPRSPSRRCEFRSSGYYPPNWRMLSFFAG